MGDAIGDPFIYQTLEEMVLASLLSIRDSDIRKKFACSILVIGGGAHMPKLTEEIMIKLNGRIEGITGFD